MNITIFDVADKAEEQFFKKEFKGHKITFFSKSAHEVPTSSYKNTQVLVVFIKSQVSQTIIDKLPKLEAIITKSTGFDHIDIAYAKQKNIIISNVKTYGENTVAEHTLALMLNLARNVHKSYLRTSQQNLSIEGLRGFDLKGKTLGVLGVGHIGLHVIRVAQALGMKVKAYDINQDAFLSEVLHFEYATLDEILQSADILTLHMPHNKYTHHFLNENTIKKTKKGVIIINTARGELIDTKALYKYLKTGHIGGAGLDVIEGEQLLSHEEEVLSDPNYQDKLTSIMIDKKIFQMENVIFTPHNAFNSHEAIQRILETTSEMIKEFIETKKITAAL